MEYILITLGIIGVVAAMTIPTLISNTNGNKYRAQFKKSISTLIQAGRLNQANYDWTFSDISEQCSGSDFMKHTSDNKLSICAILNSNLTGIQGVYRNQELTQKFKYNMKTYTKKFKNVINGSFVKEENKQEYTGSRELLVAQGYEPCGICKP